MCALLTGVHTCALPIYLLVSQLAAIRAFVVGRFVVTLRPASGVDQGQQARSFLPIFKVHPHFGGIAELFEVHARGWRDPGSDAVLPSDAVCPPFRIADDGAGRHFGCQPRSEEPSELQSLMRSSYAVFCLKK